MRRCHVRQLSRLTVARSKGLCKMALDRRAEDHLVADRSGVDRCSTPPDDASSGGGR